jgi:hypothetical protein
MTEEHTNTCSFPGCEELPADPSSIGIQLAVCADHAALSQADAYYHEWSRARELLEPMIKMAEAASDPTLVAVLEESKEKVDRDVVFWETELERLRAKL